MYFVSITYLGTFHLSLPDDNNIIPESEGKVTVVITRTGNLERGANVCKL